jgi:hypothetical protein
MDENICFACKHFKLVEHVTGMCIHTTKLVDINHTCKEHRPWHT